MKFLNIKNNMKNNSGFTMIESLVAIFIILLAITGPMVFAQNGLRTAFLSRDQITAFFLAQDVIESIKNYRNGQAKLKIYNDPTLPWFDDNAGVFKDCFDAPPPGQDIKGCTIINEKNDSGGLNVKVQKCNIYTSALGCLNDNNSEEYTPLNYEDGKLESCTQPNNSVIFSIIKADDDQNNCTRPTIFAREISMKFINSNEIEITVKVRWKSHEGIGIREIEVKENIFDIAGALLNNQ